MKKVAFCLLFVLGFGCVQAQVNVQDSSVYAPFVQANYGVQFPGADLNERFGWNSSIGGALLFKTKTNWIFGGDCNFMFGNNVDETSVLDPLRTTEGQIIDRNGEYAEISLFQRGYSMFGRFGRLFPVFSPNPNSGIVVTGGLGFLQHKIRIQNNNGNTVLALEGDYIKGYDRLSNGLAFREFVGYYYLGNKRLVNFFFGIELTQAFTQNRRTINYDTRTQSTDPRTDLQYGVQVGWIVPFYRRVAREFYYN